MSKALDYFKRDSSRLLEDEYVAAIESRVGRHNWGTVDRVWELWRQDSATLTFLDYFDANCR